MVCIIHRLTDNVNTIVKIDSYTKDLNKKESWKILISCDDFFVHAYMTFFTYLKQPKFNKTRENTKRHTNIISPKEKIFMKIPT